MVFSTSVNEEYWAVTHRSSAYMKLHVPSWIGWSLISLEQDWREDTPLGKAILLLSPSSTLIVQVYIESSVGQHVLKDST